MKKINQQKKQSSLTELALNMFGKVTEYILVLLEYKHPKNKSVENLISSSFVGYTSQLSNLRVKDLISVQTKATNSV